MIEAVITSPVIEKRSGEARRRIQLAATAEQARGRTPVEIFDLSRRGLMLACEEGFQIGEPLAVALPALGDREARVAWAKEGRYGCHFANPLSRDDLDTVLLEGRAANANDARETLGQRLRRLRKASRFTMLELAGAVGVSKPTLWKWESDRVRPRDEALRSLAGALGVAEIALLYGGPEGEAAAAAGTPPARPAPAQLATVAETVAAARRAIAEHAGVPPEAVQITIDWGI